MRERAHGRGQGRTKSGEPLVGHLAIDDAAARARASSQSTSPSSHNAFIFPRRFSFSCCAFRVCGLWLDFATSTQPKIEVSHYLSCVLTAGPLEGATPRGHKYVAPFGAFLGAHFWARFQTHIRGCCARRPAPKRRREGGSAREREHAQFREAWIFACAGVCCCAARACGPPVS